MGVKFRSLSFIHLFICLKLLFVFLTKSSLLFADTTNAKLPVNATQFLAHRYIILHNPLPNTEACLNSQLLVYIFLSNSCPPTEEPQKPSAAILTA